MRNEASAPFLAPFLFSLPPSPSLSSPPPCPAVEDGEDPSYDPYPDPPPPFVDESTEASNSPCGPTRPGKSSCKYVRNCRLCLCKHILLPPPDAPMEIGTSEFDTANFHTRKEMPLLRQRIFQPFALGPAARSPRAAEQKYRTSAGLNSSYANIHGPFTSIANFADRRD